MASACGSVTRLVTNSPVSTMLTKVSFGVTPSACGCSVIETMGGFLPTAVKNEMGARLATPLADTVLTQATGRGMILPISSL